MPNYTVEGTVVVTVRRAVDALSPESALSEVEARLEDMLEDAEGFELDGSDLFTYATTS